jgi:hypothetical protein
MDYPRWERCEAGWYQYWLSDCDNPAAVCRERYSPPWCVYVQEHMPPGDSQHRTLRDAKRAAERAVRRQR